MKRALINIDYTYDFVAEKGALTCGKPGQEIEKEIVHITKQYIENGDYVVFAIDKHEENDVYHPESKLFPPHNIAGTSGRDLFGELQDVYETYKNAENVYYMDKTRYSAFAGTDLEMKLRENKIKEVQQRQKIVVAKGETESDEINLNKERDLPNETKFEQEEKVVIDKKGILNNMKKYKYAIIGVASIVLLVVAGFAFSNLKNSQAASANNVNSLEVNANLINGLRLSAVQKYQDAALEFDKVDYKKLGKEDKKAVLFTYLLSGKAQKAIDLEQDFAESVVSYYIAVDNLKKVKELKTKNPLINFEIAALDNKHEEVIKLRDQVPLDGRREGIIVNSYLKLNRSEEAKKFAQKVGNKDLLEKINNSTPNSSATSVATISAG